MYDHFANHVLSAEKDGPNIQMTMRVVAMPRWEGKADPGKEPVLSAGWVLKALLAGLPNGILGSVRLYQILDAIYRAAPVKPTQARLITLVIVALTSEMQRELICAVFGLLTGLLQKAENLASQDEYSGNAVRPVAEGLMNADGLARVFGPLLLGSEGGTQNRDRSAQDTIEREIEEQRVVGLLFENWRSVCQQLREWVNK